MYFAGLVTEREGATVEHAMLAMNLCGELYLALRGREYVVLGSDVLFKTGSQEMLTYPDLMVFCEPAKLKPGKRNVVTNPTLVVEVLSPSTEALDRGLKSREYRLSPSIRQYALASQDRPLIEIHTRAADGIWWISEVTGLDSDCFFSSLECSIPMAALYDGVLEK